ncbi:MAG TPA: 3-hydroxyacyl-ACP dehydratase FabZ [Bdellovibrionales bacterium]|nr:3-hydroxyacyl-ACP dehydratase FabZ [Bdellovibrionales bacterium]
MAEGKAPFYNAVDILKMLPHRFPFLLVDKVLEVDQGNATSKVGWKIRATKCVTINEPFFPGHFPHRPVMPGVLQIEAMAQVAAISCVKLDGPKMDVAIAGINSARFRRPVVPGDVMQITSEVLKDRSGLLIIKCEAHVDGELACEAEIIAKMFPLVEA